MFDDSTDHPKYPDPRDFTLLKKINYPFMKYLETNVYIYCTKLLNKHFDIEQILNEIMYSKEQTMHLIH